MSRVNDKPITVTSPLLPPLEEFIPYLEKIWEGRLLTNCGPMHQALEQALCEYLGVKHISLFANGTLALITALQVLGITGEVITTPYSFVATTHALTWNGLKPVFVDIDPVTLNLNPEKIESAITSETRAILPVHCYGNICAVEEIRHIADSHNLKVIYDSAHAFGVQDAGGSVLRHGDLSILSFHATKVFNTFEGGAIVSPDAETKRRIDYLKNFGFLNETTVVMPGINGKMSEISAAFGLLQLKHIDKALERRKEVDSLYRTLLCEIAGVHCLPVGKQTVSNYAYFPILIEEDFPLSRDELYEKMRKRGILVRRYFYPLISDFSMYNHLPSASEESLPVARSIAAKILCLPIYPDLDREDVVRIADSISSVSRSADSKEKVVNVY